MKITFNRNVQFTKLIKIKGRLKEFNFRKANPGAKGLFTVDVVDNEGPMGNRVIFYMEKKDTEWQILPPEVPKWIMERENDLNEIIKEELEGSK